MEKTLAELKLLYNYQLGEFEQGGQMLAIGTLMCQAMNLVVITPVKPSSVCFPAKAIGSTRFGPAVPTIDLVLHKRMCIGGYLGRIRWFRLRPRMWMLGVWAVDGGHEPRTFIMIGGHQMEDNLLQFDLAQKRVGFSSSLLFWSTNCANFNFSSSKS